MEEERKKTKVTISYDEYEKIAQVIMQFFREYEHQNGRPESNETILRIKCLNSFP